MTTLKNNSWLYVICGLLITANIVTLAMLWMHRGNVDERRQPPAQNMFEYLTKALDFSKQQRDAYDVMRSEHHNMAEQLQKETRDAKDSLFNLLAGNATRENVMRLSNKAAMLGAQLDTMTFYHFQKVRALCTPAQQKKFDDIIQEALRMQGPQLQARRGDRPPPPGQ